MINQRMKRVNAILREVIAEECSNLKDPRIGFLTVTGVSTAPDLRAARVYYSVLGDDEVKNGTADALEAAFLASQAGCRSPGPTEISPSPDLRGRPGHRPGPTNRRASPEPRFAT